MSAQVPASPPVQIGADSLLSMLSGSQRAKTTRADLEASLREIEEVLGSSGYSAALKSAWVVAPCSWHASDAARSTPGTNGASS